MSKQYSVNMENDEVVSVEVDGVTYLDSSEIEDPHDRAKIEQLILHMSTSRTEAGFEDGFEDGFETGFGEDFDKEFEAEVQELQRQTAHFPKMIAAIFLGISALLLVIAAVSTLGVMKQLAREAETPGEVLEMVMRRSWDNETGSVDEMYYPVVGFSAADGKRLEVQLAEGSWPAAYREGEAVTVLYNPDRPQEARIKSSASTLLLWLLPLITGFVGLVFAGVGVLVLRMGSKQML